MGKKAKPLEPPPDRYLSKDGEQTLIAAKSFIYECNIFVLGFRSFHLHDSTYVVTKELKTGKLRSTKKSGKLIVIQEYTLIAAPKTWLQDKHYTFIT